MTAIVEAATFEPSRRPDIEHDLSETYQVDWKFVPNVRPTQFDHAKSLHNQARFDPIDQTVVDLYTESVRRGDIFPAVIAYRPAKGQRFVIVDGNHRLAAHTAVGVEFDMYEIAQDTDPHMIALLTFALNTRHGKPTSEEERTHQAVYLLDNGASIEAAAAAVSIPVKTLKKALSRAKADQRADLVGLKRPDWDALNATVKSRLLNINTDEGFAAAAMLAFQAKLDANEVFDLVAQLNLTKSGTKQEALVKTLRDLHQGRIQAGAGGVLHTAHRKTMGSKQRLNMAVTHALALPDDYGPLVKAYAVGERPDAAKHIREAAGRMLTLADLLAPQK